MLGLQRAEPNLYELPVEQLAEYVGRYETRIATVELTMNESGLLARVIPQGGFPTKDSPRGPRRRQRGGHSLPKMPLWLSILHGPVAALSFYASQVVASPGFAGVVGLLRARSRYDDSIGRLGTRGEVLISGLVR